MVEREVEHAKHIFPLGLVLGDQLGRGAGGVDRVGDVAEVGGCGCRLLPVVDVRVQVGQDEAGGLGAEVVVVDEGVSACRCHLGVAGAAGGVAVGWGRGGGLDRAVEMPLDRGRGAAGSGAKVDEYIITDCVFEVVRQDVGDNGGGGARLDVGDLIEKV